MSNIRQWLDGLGLGEYAEAFEAERIENGDLARMMAAPRCWIIVRHWAMITAMDDLSLEIPILHTDSAIDG